MYFPLLVESFSQVYQIQFAVHDSVSECLSLIDSSRLCEMFIDGLGFVFFLLKLFS